MNEIIFALVAGTTGIIFNKILNAIFRIYKINLPTLKKILSFCFYFLTPSVLIVYGYFIFDFDKSFILYTVINFFVLIINLEIMLSNESDKNSNRKKIINPIKPKKIKDRRDWVGIAALVIAIIFGIWGIYLSTVQTELSKAQIALSQKQDSTSLDLLHFAELLKKTDSVITLSKDQLILNREVQDRADTIYKNSLVGNMNKLLDKVYLIDVEFFNYIGGNYGGRYLSESSVRELNERLESLKALFVSEIENPYLNSNDTLKQLWSLAYGCVGELNQQIKFRLMHVGKKVLNLNTGKSEIGRIDSVNLKSSMLEIGDKIFTTVSTAISYTQNKIKKDKIQLGIIDKNGKSKISPLSFRKTITFK